MSLELSDTDITYTLLFSGQLASGSATSSGTNTPVKFISCTGLLISPWSNQEGNKLQ